MLAAVAVERLILDNPLEEQAGAAQAVWEAATQLLAEVLMELSILAAAAVLEAMAFSMAALVAQAL
jgi:hypothetical protein